MMKPHRFFQLTPTTRQIFRAALILLLLFTSAWQAGRAAAPGLPFREDFSSTALRNSLRTNANWSTSEQALLLGWRQKQFAPFGAGLAGVNITPDAHATRSVALGDMDGDGDLDLVAGNENQASRLYLNNGTPDPFNGVSGSNATPDAYRTFAIALGDVDGDGDLDLVTGNYDQANRLYLNNGTADPFNGVSGSNIGAENDGTYTVALGDVDGDGDLDLIAGNYNQVSRLYLNNGTPAPFDGVSGRNLGSIKYTLSLALGDLDGDGHLDLVTGSDWVPKQLYLNNGTADPFNGVSGSPVNTDFYDATCSMALGDVDGDGDLDLVSGNFELRNRLYLNNGTATPFNGVSGSDITTDFRETVSIALGDVDGDGDLDLMAGNNGQTARLYLNNGSANPWSGVSGSDISADIYSTYSLASGDLDGDGDLDLVTGSYGQVNRLYLNNSSANPWTGASGSNISADVDTTLSVALGDLDGDGDLDLVAGSDGQTARLYLNNGSANPWNGVSGSNISADIYSTYALALGDVDGDGDLDLVTGNMNQVNRLYLNNGTANPFNGVSGSDISADAGLTTAVALADMDGDGDLDLVAVNMLQPTRLYLNNGTSAPFSGVSGSDITADTSLTDAVAIGDLDGDGDLDLVVGINGGMNRLYLNNGTANPFNGVSGSDVAVSVDARNTTSLALGDVDGDGDLDLICGNYQANRLYLNNGTANPFNGVSGSDITSDVYTTYAVALGDVDGDGDLDLVTGNKDKTNRLYLNNGTANPWNGVSGSDITGDAADTTALALGDVDNDGDLDLVAGNKAQTNRLYLNGAMSTPWKGIGGSDISADADGTYAVALGDVDGDGDRDLVIGNNLQPNRLYLNNGTDRPWNGVSASSVSPDTYRTYALALGDVDGDGDLDLVVGNENQPNRLYLNNGTANPFNGVSGSDITTDSYPSFALALGDVDGDGDLDLMVGNYNQHNRLYLNNGTSSPFNGVSGSNITSDTGTTTSLALGDVDGDGDLDLIAGNYTQANRLYLNNGTSAPFSGVSASDISTDSDNTTSLALGDVDGDGDLDLVAGNDGQINRLYLNNGTADPFNSVSGSDISADTGSTTALALGDVDSDGDLDLAAGNYAQPSRIYLNNGTANPFNAVSGSDITSDASNTTALALGDVDGDGSLDLVAGNRDGVNRLYQRHLYHTGHGLAGSLRVDAESASIPYIYLSATAVLPANTAITYWVSNNGGAHWFQARPGAFFTFPTSGSDLRWRAALRSFSPVLTPRLEDISLALGETAEQTGVTEGGVYTIGAIYPITVQVTAAGTLDSITVTYFPTTHPQAASRIQTGAYWAISGRDSSGAPATDFTVTLTLPHTVTPDANASVCRYQGGTWTCSRTDSTATTVWLDGVTGFSDWSVGDYASSTSITLSDFSARSASTLPWVWLLIMGLIPVVGVFIRRVLKR